MDDREALNKKLFAVLKAAIFGAISLAGLYLVAFALSRFEIGYLIVMVMDSVPERIRALTGLNTKPDTLASAVAFNAVVNGICGTAIFSLGAIVYQFAIKNDYEK